MILAYLLVVASLVLAWVTGYVVAALWPGRIVEVGIISFGAGMAWAAWLADRERE